MRLTPSTPARKSPAKSPRRAAKPPPGDSLLFAAVPTPKAGPAEPALSATLVDSTRVSRLSFKPYRAYEEMAVLIDGIPAIPADADLSALTGGPEGPPAPREPPIFAVRPIAKKDKPALPPPVAPWAEIRAASPRRGKRGRAVAPDVSIFDVEHFSAAEAAAFVEARGGKVPGRPPAATARMLAMVVGDFDRGYTLAQLREFLEGRGLRAPDKEKKAAVAARVLEVLGLGPDRKPLGALADPSSEPA